jgi:hypothetical protein
MVRESRAWRGARWVLGVVGALGFGSAALGCGETTRQVAQPASAGEAGRATAGGTPTGATGGGPQIAGSGGAPGGAETAGASAGPVMAPVDPFEGTPEQYWRSAAETARMRRQECLGIRADADTSGGGQILSAGYIIDAEVAQRESQYAASIGAGRARFDAELAAICLDRLTTQSCDDFRRDVALNRDCIDSAVLGLVSRGGECAAFIDCADPADFCEGGTTPPAHCTARAQLNEGCASRPCAPGTVCPAAPIIDLEHLDQLVCVPDVPGPVGLPCSSSHCVEGALCTAENVCRAYAPSSPCQKNADCTYHEACLIAPGGGSGHCGPGRAEGEPCRRDSAFESDCAFPLDCRSTNGGELTCTNTWVRVGERCRNTGSAGGVVCIDGVCDIKAEDRATQEGICVPLGDVGAPCYGGSCLPGLDCTASGCQPA